MTHTAATDNAIRDIIAEHDRKNLDVIARAAAAGKINPEAREYLETMYSDGLVWFQEMFHLLGKSLGAPKAPVMLYDYDNDSGIDEPIKISEISPLSPYLVHHRLDGDPMRNQFFTSGAGHKIDLSVSSIVTVIVGAQKKIERALAKVTGKYYDDYVRDVAETAYRVIAAHEREASARAISDKIYEKFRGKFITTASETVLGIIGRGHEEIAVKLVRELDRVTKPHLRLCDVWRVKCLFDLVPQARTFIERIHEMMPDRIMSIRDKFYDMDNPRNYRDAKVIVEIGSGRRRAPMEIICQVRTFFDYERKTHDAYAVARSQSAADAAELEQQLASFMAAGVREYNLKICHYLDDLFDRVGWNILYSQDREVALMDGFPRNCTLYYPPKVLEIIFDKLDNAIENEVFHVTDAPAKLTQAQESKIFRWMTRFILVSAMPYLSARWDVPADTLSGRLFNFVMKEVQRYYKK